jgi:hypothetical protein
MRTDTELLDALEALVDRGDCPGIIRQGVRVPGLVNDDNGNWAVSASGMQNVVCGDEPSDVETTFFIEAKDWKPTLREAINYYLDEANAES